MYQPSRSSTEGREMQDDGGVRPSADDARPAQPGIHKR